MNKHDPLVPNTSLGDVLQSAAPDVLVIAHPRCADPAVKAQLASQIAAVLGAVTPQGFIPAIASHTYTMPTSLAGSGTPLLLGGRILDRVNVFLDERRRGGISAKNLAEAAFALQRVVLEVFSDRPLALFDIAARDAVVEVLKLWPVNASKKPEYKGLTVAETIEKGKKEGAPTLDYRTVEKYLTRIRTFFNWALERRYLNFNPFAGLRVLSKARRLKRTKRPFTEDELQKLFDPALLNACNKPFKIWIPRMALFMALRCNEAAQLHVDDVCQIGDVWVVKVDDLRPDQHLKNESSRRVVPIHRQLLDMGFLDYWRDVKQAGFDRLFPELPYCDKGGYGHAVSKWFGDSFLRPASPGSKAPRAGIKDRLKSFHSFRYVAVNALYGITTDLLLIADITGHERGKDVLRAVYITPSEAEQRAALLNQVAFPFLQFGTYRQGQFKGFFLRLKRQQSARYRGR